VLPVRYELNLYMLCRRKWTVSVVYWSKFLATDPEVPDSIPVAIDFLRSSGSGTRSNQPREYN
jgi:hypothetical protein